MKRAFVLLSSCALLLGCGDGLLGFGGGAASQEGKPDGDDGPATPPPIEFGGPGPWPLENASYGAGNGILEQPVVGVSTDEAQNLWVATHAALYLLQPGQTTFRRYAAAEGLHLAGNPVTYCDSNFSGGDKSCPITGAAASPGILSLVGGGANEVFVGYAGVEEGSGDWADPNRHSGKLDRVRLHGDGTLRVDRMDLVSNNHGAMYWHNRSVLKIVYDHFHHAHELYVGANHGITRIKPDLFREPKKGEWFDMAYREWMGDHLHPRVCFHAPCIPDSETGQRMGDWQGLAVASDGDLWVAGKWTAGKIKWSEDLQAWYGRPGAQTYAYAFGDPYPAAANADGFINEPVFRPPLEGDPVYLSSVAVAADGRVWFGSNPSSGGTAYGLAVFDGKKFTTFDPVTDLGLPERAIVDLAALPDGRLVIAQPRSGVTIFNPATGAKRRFTGGNGLPSDLVTALEVDRMVSPPAINVSTWSGAAVLRNLDCLSQKA